MQKSLKRKQESKTELDIADILELSNLKFKITMITILSEWEKKIEKIQGHMGNLSREMETPRIKRKC